MVASETKMPSDLDDKIAAERQELVALVLPLREATMTQVARPGEQKRWLSVWVRDVREVLAKLKKLHELDPSDPKFGPLIQDGEALVEEIESFIGPSRMN